MLYKTKWKTIELVLDASRFGSIKSIIAIFLVVSFLLFFAKQVMGILDNIPDSEIKAFVSFAFIIVGLVTILDDEE